MGVPKGDDDPSCDVAILIPRINAPGGAERQALRLAGFLAAEGLDVAIVAKGCRDIASPHPSVRLLDVEPVSRQTSMSEGWLIARVQDRLHRTATWRTVKRWRALLLDATIRLSVARARRVRVGGRRPILLDGTILALATMKAKKFLRFRELLEAIGPRTVVSFLDAGNLYAALALMKSPVRLVTSYRSDPLQASHGAGFGGLRYLTHLRADIVGANTSSALTFLRQLPELRETALALTPNIGLAPSDPDQVGDAHRFVVVGRLVPSKRASLAIERFADVAPLLPAWELHFLGDGPERSSAEALARDLGVAHRVCFHGFVDDVPTMLMGGGILLYLSDWEGTPNAIMEAMAVGLPSIVTDSSPGPLELIRGSGEPSGLVCSVADPESISESMLQLAADRLLRQRLGAAARRGAELATWPALRQTWFEILDIRR